MILPPIDLRSAQGMIGAHLLRILVVLTLPLTAPQSLSQALFPTEIIYNNSSGSRDFRRSSIDEFGDEIIFGGTFREVVIFRFEYFGEFVPQGDETCTVRFYLNDDDSDGRPGFERPGTMIYESETFTIFPGFNSVALTDLDLTVPNRITWTADFDGLSGLGGDRASLVFSDPPSIGKSFDDIWKKTRSGLWVAARFNANPVANLAAQFVSKVDLSLNIVEAEILDKESASLTVQGPPGRRILVERSHDLETWTPVFVGKLESRRLRLIDINADVPFPRFFRTSLVQDKEITLTGPRFREDGLVEFTTSGPHGLSFKLQSTTDLLTWKDVSEFTFATRDINIIDDDLAETGPKIYRVILAPRFEPANQNTGDSN